MMRIDLTTYLLCVLLCAAGCSTVTTSQGASGQSTQNAFGALTNRDRQELEVGTEIHSAIMGQSSSYTHPEVNQYVSEVGWKLARQAERPYLPYQFTILYDERIYATQAPGGFVYITTGMLCFVENEAELAAVLAHEVARVQYRPVEFSKVKRMVETVGPLSQFAGLAFPPAGVLAPLTLAAIDSTFLQDKTVEERTYEADAKSLGYIIRSGFDPQGAIDVIYKLAAVKGTDLGKILNYYTTHPLTPERVNRLNLAFQQLDLANKPFSTNWQRYRDVTRPVREIYRK